MNRIKFMERSFIDSALKDLFVEIFPEIVEDIRTFLEDNQFADTIDILYNVPNEQLSRGLSVVTAFHYCGNNVNHINLRKACVLGWCIEMLQASFHMMEDSHMTTTETTSTRSLIKDAFVLENSMYFIIRKYFRQDTCYADLLTYFHDVVLKLTLGHSLKKKYGSDELQEMNLEQYQQIIRNHISYYSFYFPIYLAFVMGGITDEVYLSHIEIICDRIGYIYQIQEDVMDCFENSFRPQQKNIFIGEGRSTWPILRALEIANAEQRQILIENYGQGVDDHEKILKVKDIFKELNIYEQFLQLEERFLQDINSLICHLGNSKHVQFFTSLVNSFYKKQR